MSRKNLKVHLFIIDPQNDFMGYDDGSPYTIKRTDGRDYVAQLPVKRSVSDAKRLSALIDRTGPRIEDIHITFDSHHSMHVAVPDMWQDANGRPPAPFTLIRADDMKNGIWKARNPNHQKRFYDYLVALEATGKFLHCIWPPHCRIGTWGHNMQEDVEAAITRWERKEMAVANTVTKGSAVWEEHFGGLMAEVVDPNDPSTQLNAQGLLVPLQQADIIGVAGWASSHCVKRTVEQVADNIGSEHIRKMVLLIDCMSPVPAIPGVDFPAIAQQFLKDMQARGMTLMKSTEFLA